MKRRDFLKTLGSLPLLTIPSLVKDDEEEVPIVRPEKQELEDIQSYSPRGDIMSGLACVLFHQYLPPKQ